MSECRGRTARKERSRRAVLQHVDRGLDVLARRSTRHAVDHASLARRDVRPRGRLPVSCLIAHRQRLRCPAGGRDSHQGSGFGRKDDERVGAPGATARHGGVAQRVGEAAGDVEAFQPLFGEEADLPAVRRPEGKRGAFGPAQLPPFGRRERTDPQAQPATGIARGDDKLLSVGRNGELGAVRQLGFVRQRQGEADDRRRRAGRAGASKKERGERKQ